MSDPREMPKVFASLRSLAIVVAVLGLGALLVDLVQDSASFYRSYLFGYLFVLSMPLGCLGLLQIHHLVGGAWGFIIQRILEAGSRTIYFMPLLFIPVVVGAPELYHWMDAEAVAQDQLLAHKAPYLNFGFWVVRAAVYFAIWSGLALLLNGLSKKQDETGDGRLSNSMSYYSGPGLVLYFLTMTFAAFDWAMSLEPHWFSTIYGLIFVEGQGLTAMAFSIVVLMFLRRNTVVGQAATVDRIHDLGKLQFAMIALWAYLNFSQYLIIWYANLPEETVWYAHRTHGGYEYLAVFLIFGQFVLPFFLLITRMTKRRMEALAGIATYILVVRLVDIYWLVMPTEHHTELHVTAGNFGAPLGLFGLWFVLFYWNLGQRSLIVERDPRWMEKLAHEHEH
jgi:hypothetical protein